MDALTRLRTRYLVAIIGIWVLLAGAPRLFLSQTGQQNFLDVAFAVAGLIFLGLRQVPSLSRDAYGASWENNGAKIRSGLLFLGLLSLGLLAVDLVFFRGR